MDMLDNQYSYIACEFYEFFKGYVDGVNSGWKRDVSQKIYIYYEKSLYVLTFKIIDKDIVKSLEKSFTDELSIHVKNIIESTIQQNIKNSRIDFGLNYSYTISYNIQLFIEKISKKRLIDYILPRGMENKKATRILDKIYNLICDAGEQGLSHTELTRSTQRLKKYERDNFLCVLTGNGMVEMFLGTKGNRKKRIYKRAGIGETIE